MSFKQRRITFAAPCFVTHYLPSSRSGVSDEPDSAAQTTALPQGSASKPSQASEQDAVPSKPSSSTRQFWRLWRTPRSSRKRKSVSTTGGKDSHSGIKGVRLPESQSACSICLCGESGRPCLDGSNSASVPSADMTDPVSLQSMIRPQKKLRPQIRSKVRQSRWSQIS